MSSEPNRQAPGVKAIEAIIREHIKVDASGLAPAVGGYHIDGFEEAAQAVLSALVPSAPAVEGVELKLVERLQERARTMNGAEPVGAGDGHTYTLGYYSVGDRSLDHEAASAISRLVKERDEALGFASHWHRTCESIATVLGLPEPEGNTFAQQVVDKFSAAEASVARLTALLAEADAVIHNIHVRTVGWRNVLDLADKILPFLSRYQQKREAK